QMVGIVAGALSSIFLATPLLVDLTMRLPAYQQQAARVIQRRERMAGAAGTGTGAAEDAVVGGSRREESLTAASGVPARVGKSAPAAGRPRGRSGSKGARPSGKAARPSGKRQR
ncbi:MAG TPA: protein translocase subunit SecF, partial [Pseudonocardiaceae bacterium]|nr:protein translocase subunit SecF [Pseudonocardiaceae bacterium]